MTGYQNLIRYFKQGTFVASGEISKSTDFGKALISLNIVPTFFRGIYYVPTTREKNGHFIERPGDFFYNLFNFAYGRRGWYWSLSTAARNYGLEWSATKILEIVSKKESKTINISERIESLKKKKSYRSKILSKIFSSLDTNLIAIHMGKDDFFKDVKINPEIGPMATKERLRKDIDYFKPKTRIKALRNLYEKIYRKL